MPLDFEPLRRFLPTPELRALLEQEIAAIGSEVPGYAHERVTVSMALGRLANTAREYPIFVRLPASEPSPLAPWLLAYGAEYATTLDYGRHDVRHQVEALQRFGARAIGPLALLSGAASLPLRALVYPALAKALGANPRGIDEAALIAALVRGVADSSAKVRSAAFGALSKYPATAKTALAQAAAGLSGKPLKLTNEALARLGAPADGSEAPSPPDPEDAALLGNLVALWEATRAPQVADLVELLSSKLPAPELGGRSKTEREGEWHVVAKRRGPATLASLLAAPWPSQWRDGAKRLAALRGWSDPRIATALATVLEAQPYPSTASFAFYREALKDLTALRDARQLGPLKKAGAALQARFSGYFYLSDFTRAAEGKSLEDALRASPPREPRPDDPLVSRARSRLAGVKAEAEQRARTERDFLDAIYAEPDTEELRRVFADWLIERGDVRGEFIALQCERAAGRGSAQSERREWKIRAEHEELLLGGLRPFLLQYGRVFERGFLFRATTDSKLLAGGLDVPAWATVRILTIPESADAQVLARFLRGAGRRVTALHNVLPDVASELSAALGQDCPLEELGLRTWVAVPLTLALPRLRRLGIIRARYSLATSDRARASDSLLSEPQWAQLEQFWINDTWNELPGWHLRFERMPWLRAVRVLSAETESLTSPQGFEVRFEREREGGGTGLFVEAHRGAAEQAAPVVEGLGRLPADLRRTMTIVESPGLGAEARAELQRCQGSGAGPSTGSG